MTKRKAKRVAPEPVPAPAAVITIAPTEAWYRSIFTDAHGEFDTGRVLVAVVILALIYFEYVHVVVHNHDFDAQSFGIAVGAVLAGFAGYLFGDAQRPPAPAPSTTTELKQTQVTTP